MKISEFISEKATSGMRSEIKRYGGNEIFFRGIPDENGIISEFEVIARGNAGSVAALLNMMRKNEVIVHNHPSGDTSPSMNDIKFTEEIKRILSMLGIELIDHVIIGDGEYRSIINMV